MAGKPRFSSEVKDRWVHLAQQGLSAFAIARLEGVHHSTIAGELKNRGIFRRNYDRNTKLSDEQRRQICDKYKQGIGATTLAREYGVDKRLVYLTLNKAGVGTRPRSNRINGECSVRNNIRDQRCGGTWGGHVIYETNHNVFSILSPESLYWLGFLFADGNVHKYNWTKGRIAINLQMYDRPHLEAFDRFIGGNGSRVKIENAAGFGGERNARITVSSQGIYNDLVSFGIVANKSQHDCLPDQRLLCSSDFWRGVFDGDGCLYDEEGPGRPYLAGHKNLLDAFAKWCAVVKVETDGEPTFVQTTFRQQVRSVKDLCRALGYDGPGPYLYRKWLIACSVLSPVGGRRANYSWLETLPSTIVKIDGREIRLHNTPDNGTLYLPQPSDDATASFLQKIKNRYSNRFYLALPHDSPMGWQSLWQAKSGGLTRTTTARECLVIRARSFQAENFYDNFHIQGYCGKAKHYALVFSDMIVAMMSFSAPNGVRSGFNGVMLSRFACRGSVPGAASKLLTAFRREYPSRAILTFSDNRYTDGGIYSRLGFTYDGAVAASYIYCRDGRVWAKSKKQKSVLLAEAQSDIDATESVLAERLGYKKIWDLGKKRWVMPALQP